MSSLKTSAKGGAGGLDPSAVRKKTSDFNSWVIGGHYAKTTLKKAQVRADLEMKRKVDTGDEKLAQRIAERKEALREERAKAPVIAYNPKVPAALRESGGNSTNSRGQSREGRQQQNSREGGSRRRTSPPNSPQKKQREEQHDHLSDGDGGGGGEDLATSKSLRQRLKTSFHQITVTHAYGTLFPPLLTPYNRHCQTRTAAGTHTTAVTDTGLHGLDDAARHLSPARVDPLSVVAKARVRAHPQVGPKAFFPTGNPTTAYRHFTTYGNLTQTSSGGQHDMEEESNVRLDGILHSEVKNVSTKPSSPTNQHQQQHAEQEQQPAAVLAENA